MLSLMGVQGCGRFRQDSASSAAWGRGFASLGGICGSEHWDFQLPLLIHVAALASGIWKWDIAAIIETSEVCTYSSGRYILFSFFSPLFLPFFPPSFNKILGTKTHRAGSDRAYNRQSSSQLNTPDVLPVPKGSHCLRGFLLNRTKQNSKALGLLGC